MRDGNSVRRHPVLAVLIRKGTDSDDDPQHRDSDSFGDGAKVVSDLARVPSC